MAKKDITEGSKKARAVAMRRIKSSKETTAMEVMFEFEEPTTKTIERLPWQGWRTEKAMEYTVETLIRLGYNGSEAIDANGIFTDPAVLDFRKEVEIVVQMEDSTDEQGRIWKNPKIRWVNDGGGSSKFASVTPETVKSLPEDGFKAAFLMANKNKPAATKKLPF